MTDWQRVGKLRAQGKTWAEIATDKKVGFHAPEGVNAARALKTLSYRRKSNAQGGRRKTSDLAQSAENHTLVRFPRGRYLAIGGASVSVAILVLYLLFLPGSQPPGPTNYTGPGATGSTAQYNYLAQQHTDICHWPGVQLGDETANVNLINGWPDGEYLQGSCCSPMDVPDYTNQTSQLPSYSSVSIIPQDPYNMPTTLAKSDLSGLYMSLTSAQESTLSTASGLTNDHGWCCCQCWAYYVHEGLAKQLLVNHGYSAQQIAAVMNLEDCCGGPGPMSM